MLRFYAYYLLQVWPIFAVLLVVGLAGALVEVALFSFLADIVDLARDTPPAEFFQRHAGLLLWMAVVVMVLRPLAIAAHDLLTHQTIAPSLTTLVRWQNHRRAGPGAGVLPQRLRRPRRQPRHAGSALRDSAVQSVDALWHVILYVVSALYLFAEADWRLVIPLVLWIVGYCCMLGYFVPRMQARAVTASEARSSSWAASSTAIPTSARSSSSPMPGRKRTTHARRWPNRRKSSSCRPASSPRWTCPSTR